MIGCAIGISIPMPNIILHDLCELPAIFLMSDKSRPCKEARLFEMLNLDLRMVWVTRNFITPIIYLPLVLSIWRGLIKNEIRNT